jgi:hypothetical protein
MLVGRILKKSVIDCFPKEIKSLKAFYSDYWSNDERTLLQYIFNEEVFATINHMYGLFERYESKRCKNDSSIYITPLQFLTIVSNNLLFQLLNLSLKNFYS